jgi:hypothetical protein
MNTAQPTPGDWTVEPIGDDELCILAGAGEEFGEPVSHLATMTDPREFGEGVQAANAAILAASKDTLAACRLFVAWERSSLEHGVPRDAALLVRAMVECHKAIAKATGEAVPT